MKALRTAIDHDRRNERAWRNLCALYRKQGLTELATNCEEEARSALGKDADRGIADLDLRSKHR